MSKDHSRRAVLAGIAAAPALAAPALALSDPAADAELIELGRKLDPIIEEWHAKRATDRVQQDAFEAEVREATGIAFKDAPEMTRHPWPAGSYWGHLEKYRWPDPCKSDSVLMAAGFESGGGRWGRRASLI